MVSPFRQRLRQDTRAAHDRVDAAFGRFHLGTADGYRRFLTAHHDALSRLALDPPPCGLPDLGLVPLLSADLAALGCCAGQEAAFPIGDEAERVGAYYVVTGSRMGAQVLERAWRSEATPDLLGAGRYLSDRAALSGWNALNVLLSSPEPLNYEAVRRGAMATFGLFEDAARRAAEKPVRSAA